MYGKVLVPLNSPRLADIVLPYAEVMAGALNSRVTLLYVAKTREKHQQKGQDFCLGKVAGLVRSHVRENYPEKEPANIRVKSVDRHGGVAEQISSYIKKNKISLAIMSGHGHTGIMRRPMVSTVRKVFHTTGVPLLLVRNKPPVEAGFPSLLNRILLPLDGLKGREIALPFARELARRLPAEEVILLQVVPPEQRVHTLGGLDYVRFTEEQIEVMKDIVREYLGNISRRLTATKATIRCEVRVGDPAMEINRCAEETDSRVIVLATHRHAWLRQWVWGSVPQSILQTTTKPVLLITMPD